MSKELPTTYDPKTTGERIYARWMDQGWFHPEVDETKEPFTIVIPPPNITGQLHMGHALDNTIQDALIRTKRMQGYSALWLPGTDHASIATEVRIIDAMAKEGLKKEEVGREAFLERAWAWKGQYGGRIVEQLKKLGSSLDWSRERFTMDEGLSKAVRTAFKRLYDKGLIYQGNRIINWCPSCLTALSDAEVEYEEAASHLWLVRYPAEDGGEGIVVATTRPETMLGDTAVAVNPADTRYTRLIGKNVILPLMDRPIPVIADDYVDMEFGTGAVKITPAHDPNDYEVGQRHNLPMPRVMGDDGSINELGGKYAGLDRYEARGQIVEDLRQSGLLAEVKDYTHNVGQCYRCNTVIEPILSKQWFVKMKELAGPAIKAVENGDVRFIPDRFSKIYFNWMYNIKDWCISRQLWWGHRIPAYTCRDCGALHVEDDAPVSCECGGTSFVQDEDVLDTWFSSGLWPFSTLGWPDDTADLEYFYPTNVLVTSYDIIFFWVARMIFFGIEMMGRPPFQYVNIHGLVRDDQGRKMSKSLDNGVDPLDVIDQYGADALRFSLAMGVSPGNDMRFYTKKVEAARNFVNKIWNASRFVLMNTDGSAGPVDESALDIADKWIIAKLNDAIAEVTRDMDDLELGLAAQKLYDFFWSEFCDWYIEMAKSRLYGEDQDVKSATINVLVYVLRRALKLLHPFMPFITEEIYTSLPGSDETIMLSAWPEAEFGGHAGEARMMQEVMEMIRSVRNIRSEMDVPQKVKVKITVLTDNGGAISACADYIKKLAYASDVEVIADKSAIPANSVSVVSAIGEAFLPLSGMIDVEAEIARIQKKIKDNASEIARAEGKLKNKGFADKAPEAVIREERDKLAKYADIRDKLTGRLAFLEKMK
jgi:valyl-tRNA synthetase